MYMPSAVLNLRGSQPFLNIATSIMLYVKVGATFAIILAAKVGAVPVQRDRVKFGQVQAQFVDEGPAIVKKMSNGTVSSCAEVKAKGLCSHKLAKTHCGETCMYEEQNQVADPHGEHHVTAASKVSREPRAAWQADTCDARPAQQAEAMSVSMPWSRVRPRLPPRITLATRGMSADDCYRAPRSHRAHARRCSSRQCVCRSTPFTPPIACACRSARVARHTR